MLEDRDRAMWQLRIVIATIQGEVSRGRGNGMLAERSARIVDNTVLNYDVGQDRELSETHATAVQLIRSLLDGP